VVFLDRGRSLRVRTSLDESRRKTVVWNTLRYSSDEGNGRNENKAFLLDELRNRDPASNVSTQYH